MKNNSKNKQIKYVKYFKNLANSELADITVPPVLKDDLGGKRAGAKLRAYSEADALIADVALSVSAKGQEKQTGPLTKGGKIKYHCLTFAQEDFRQEITGQGIVNRESVEHAYKHTNRSESDNVIYSGNEIIQSVGFLLKKTSEQGKEIKLAFPAVFAEGGFFFAPINLQAKIKKLKQDNPDLFYQRSADEKNFKVTELLARKFFLYIGLHRNNTDKIKIKTDDLFKALRPALMTAAGRCRSYPGAERMLSSLIDIYNAVIDIQPSDCLAKIKGLKETEKHQFLINFSTARKPKKRKKMAIKAAKTWDI